MNKCRDNTKYPKLGHNFIITELCVNKHCSKCGICQCSNGCNSLIFGGERR